MKHYVNRIQTTVKQIQHSWKILSENRIIRFSVYGGLIASLFASILILVSWGKLPPFVPLWYSKPWGIDRLAQPFWLFLPPLISIVFTGINISVAGLYLMDHLVFSQILFITSCVTSIMASITIAEIILMVI